MLKTDVRERRVSWKMAKSVAAVRLGACVCVCVHELGIKGLKEYSLV